MRDPRRREWLGGLAALATACGAERGTEGSAPIASAGETAAKGDTMIRTDLRSLGKTGAQVEAFSLGGEGVLRTHGREREAVAVILKALELGVRYCDTAPAYASSQSYYGAAFREAGPKARDSVFLATKTHERSREGALRLLDDSLKRLGTDHVDLWQMHDLRTPDDLAEMFAKGGAIEAAEQAKQQGRVRFIGITGHHDPSILVEAMRRYDFDTVLAALNPADPRRQPFQSTVVAEARKRGMGIIGMKALGVGRIVADGVASADELIRYTASLADTVIIGCKTPEEVAANVATARAGEGFSADDRRKLEARVAPTADRYDTFKA
ncbi:MAG: aldo/keto reductase [Myxococcales bacterium]|nr:aldo/keto reductase [Myxococcales bacterium]